MKVILLQELKGRGGEGDVVEVKRGYAVNYLFPQKIALEASKGNLKQLELRKHNIAKRESDRLDSADKIQAALSDKVLTIAARVGEEGQLFGSVTTQQISEKLQEVFGLEIDRKKLDLRAPIKTAGEHRVTVSVYRDIKAVLTIDVVSDEVIAEGQEQEEKPASEAQAENEPNAENEEAVEAIEEIVEQANEAMEAVANTLTAAVDASDSDEGETEAITQAAVEVFKEAEEAIDTMAEAAVEEISDNAQ